MSTPVKTIQKFSPEEFVITMKNQLVIVEDTAGERRKEYHNQLYGMIIKQAELIKNLGKDKMELEQELDRLIRVLGEHNIDAKPLIKYKNRKEKRAAEQSTSGITKIPE